jgi:hypothetical protein
VTKLTKAKRAQAKAAFSDALHRFVERLRTHVSSDDGNWTVKGFIDIYRNIYTISSDTKVISKILEIHLFPQILQFAEEQRYSIVLAEHQNWYPDFSFVSQGDPRLKFAVDLKTTYRDPKFPGHVNGFTLGSHGAYFKDRTSAKNIQFPYSEYSGHFCLGIIYTRVDVKDVDETEIIKVKELDANIDKPQQIGQRQVTTVENLRSITSVIKDFEFFVCEKWQLASDRQGSGNTANIGSITFIEDILNGNGVFAKLGEDWFDEYWMNYGVTTMKKKGKAVPIRRLEDFIDFKGGDKSLIVPMITKKRRKKS